MHPWRPTANRSTLSSRDGEEELWGEKLGAEAPQGRRSGGCKSALRAHAIPALTPLLSPRLRFAKLLLRLPALRSIGLKCLEHLFFFKLIGDTPIDTFLMEMLEAPHQLA